MLTSPRPTPAGPPADRMTREAARRRNPFGRPTELAIREMMKKAGCTRQEAVDFILSRD